MDDTKQTLDLDALLSIVRKRTPGEWLIDHDIRKGGVDQIIVENRTVCFMTSDGDLDGEDVAAIVTAINNFEAVAERCKRAEEWNDYDATISDLTRQRDELLAALRNIAGKALAVRCKRAEQSVEALKAGIIDVQNEYAELERQRDELQNRCGELWDLLHSAAAFVPRDTEMVLFDQIQVALDKGAFVKGVTDGKA